jgi:hypothetical protein
MAKQEKFEEKQLVYVFENVLTTGFSFRMPENKPETFEIVYSVTPLITSNIEQNKVFLRLKVNGSIQVENKEEKEQVIFIETLSIFKVDALIDHVKLQGNEHVFGPEYHTVMVVFMSLSLSTLRGILLEKLHGTIYANKMLPIFDPKVFFQKTDSEQVGS